MHAIMAEDAATVRMFYRSILEAAGFSVGEAMNGVEALERALSDDTPPDLFLVDVNMPLMDGYTFLRKIRSEARLRAVPAIIISTMREARDEERAFEAGANLVLAKPVTPEALSRFARVLACPPGARYCHTPAKLLP